MKKQVMLALCLLAAAPAFAGDKVCGTSKNLASPFYMPKDNQWVVSAQTDFTRSKVAPVKAWTIDALAEVGYGITDNVKVFVQGGNIWDRWKPAGTGSRSENHNEQWGVGASYNMFSESFPILATLGYVQARTHGYQGDYKAIYADVKKDFCTCCKCDIDSYVGASIEVPIFQSAINSNDEPKYAGYAGVFRPWTSWLATDLRGIFSYDSETSTRKPSVFGEVSVLPFDNVALGVYAEQALWAKTKNHNNVHEQKVGVEAKVQF